MSNTDVDRANPTPCTGGAHEDALERLDARVAQVGTSLTIRRALPNTSRRMIGAWCFLDHFGPVTFQSRTDGMWVGEHPHIGLQTVTWLYEGSVLHRDSIGSVERIQPGGLNVMTAGRGIAHTEESPTDHEGELHGVQLWLALPEKHAEVDPAFEHVGALPVFENETVRGTVFIGQGLGVESPATVYSPLLGAEVNVTTAGTHRIPLEPAFEHGVVVGKGKIRVDGTAVEIGHLAYLAPGRRELVFETDGPVRFTLVGGEPFGEDLLLWWNFVGRSHDEIADALNDWQARARFGHVEGFEGGRLVAPDLEGRLKPRPPSRRNA